MNCFEWRNHASDYLDGALIGAMKSEADRHLDSCKECSERQKHFRIILSSVSSQPRTPLPIPIRKAPLSSGRPLFDIKRLGRWDRIPWYLRTTLEGVGIVAMILLGISAGPRIRSLYEKSLETNLQELTQSFHEWRDSNPEVTTPETAPLLRGKAALAGVGASSEEFASSEEGSSENAASDSKDDDDGELAGDTTVDGGNGSMGDADVRVGSSEIWRFILKSDSPHDIRPKIVKILTDLQIPQDTPGLGGVEAPGGIQFDLLVPQAAVNGIKKQLQAIAPKAPAELAQTPAGETFTWYKNKSKKPLPPQKIRVVIWLSQM